MTCWAVPQWPEPNHYQNVIPGLAAMPWVMDQKLPSPPPELKYDEVEKHEQGKIWLS